MTGQPWLAVTFAAITILTAAYCLTRLVLSWRHNRPTDRPVDSMHVLMGPAMAGMLVPGLRVLRPGGWELVFTAAAVVFLWRIARALGASHAAGSAQAAAAARAADAAHRPAHDGQHLLGCLATLYMLAATPSGHAPGTSMAAGVMSGAAGSPTLALLLAVALLACVVWTADRISTMAPVGALAHAAGATAGPVPALTDPAPRAH